MPNDRRGAYALFIAISVVFLVFDQLTKALVLANLAVHESRVVLEGVFNLTHVRNPGAAFGFLAGAPELFRRIFFVGVTLLVMLVVLYYFRRGGFGKARQTVALALVMAGGAGNLIDRVRFGEVVDFLDIYLGRYHWPAFNVADAAISVGVILLAFDLLGKSAGEK